MRVGMEGTVETRMFEDGELTSLPETLSKTKLCMEGISQEREAGNKFQTVSHAGLQALHFIFSVWGVSEVFNQDIGLMNLVVR